MIRQSSARLAIAFVIGVLLVGAPALGTPSPGQAHMDPLLVEQLASAESDEHFLVFVHSSNSDNAKSVVRESGLDLVNSFDKVGVAVGVGTAPEIQRAASMPGVQYLEADRPIAFSLTTSHQATRADAVISGFTGATQTSTALDGTGSTIAIVDTGVDGTHPMFQQGGTSKVVRNLKLACLAFTACTGPQGDANDTVWIDETALNDTDTQSAGGHGTHVAAIAAGVPVTTSDGRNLQGAAPGAKLVSLSVGASLSIYGGSSGLNWVLEHSAAPCGTGVSVVDCPPITSVNNSYGPVGGGEFNANSVSAKIQDALVAAGVTVVWAAGNGDETNDGGDGSDNRVNPEAQSPTPGVIGVANYDDDDSGTRNGGLHSSSSRGEAGRTDTYPDVSAPGSSITAACRPYLSLCTSLDADPNFGTISGTSMAAPHVAGYVALLRQADPSITPAEIEDLLEDNAFKFTDGAAYESDPRNTDNSTSFDKGHGLVDIKAAIAELRDIALPSETPLPTIPFECTASGAVAEDPEGDTYIVKFIPTNTDVPPYEAALDIREGRLSWDGTSQTLTAKVIVQDLPQDPPTSAPDISYNVNFYHAGERYYLEATRDQLGTHFVFGRWTMVSTQGARFTLGQITGSFDSATDTVSIIVSNSDLTAMGVAALEQDEVLTGITFASRRPIRTDATTAGLTTDSTSELCEFKIGMGVTPPPPPPPPPPFDGSISPSSPEYPWESEVVADVVLPFTGTNASGCDGGRANEACSITKVDVTLGTGSNMLEFTITGDETHTFYLYVYAPDGTSFGSGDGGDLSSTTQVNNPATQSGVYTVVVRASATLDGEYAGLAKLTEGEAPPPEGEFDGEISPGESYDWTGTVIPQPIFYCSGAPQALCDNELVKLNVPSGGATLTVVITPGEDDLLGLSVQIYDPNGTRIAEANYVGGVIELSTPVSLGGVYRVAVSGSTTLQTYSGTASLS